MKTEGEKSICTTLNVLSFRLLHSQKVKCNSFRTATESSNVPKTETREALLRFLFPIHTPFSAAAKQTHGMSAAKIQNTARRPCPVGEVL